MSEELLHLWCDHCSQSLCGLVSESYDLQLDELGAEDEGLDCVVCADLAWASRRQERCRRVVA